MTAGDGEHFSEHLTLTRANPNFISQTGELADPANQNQSR